MMYKWQLIKNGEATRDKGTSKTEEGARKNAEGRRASRSMKRDLNSRMNHIRQYAKKNKVSIMADYNSYEIVITKA